MTTGGTARAREPDAVNGMSADDRRLGALCSIRAHAEIAARAAYELAEALKRARDLGLSDRAIDAARSGTIPPRRAW